MFMFANEKEQLKMEIIGLKSRLNAQQEKLNFLFSRIESHINKNHPYGLTKDGTPKAKPGRKPK